MASTAYSNPRGAEISERSSELVLPDVEGSPRDISRSLEVTAATPVEPPTTAFNNQKNNRKSDPNSEAIRDPEAGRKQREFGVIESEATTSVSPPGTSEESKASTTPRTPQTPRTPPETTPETPNAALGAALPGDRGPRDQAVQSQRPSFWRRIALGRRNPEASASQAGAETATSSSAAAASANGTPAAPGGLATRVAQAVAPAPKHTPPADTSAIESRIVEPMLQALVSVEAKLERSHGELVGRSDQVEQRLTQLWDIEEQLGQLSELQESLLKVSEQQRRLETAVVSQTKTLRWLVGAVFFSLSAAAFTVAAIIR